MGSRHSAWTLPMSAMRPAQDGDSDMDVAPAVKKRKKRKVHPNSSMALLATDVQIPFINIISLNVFGSSGCYTPADQVPPASL
jgi:hypothetical protein